MSIDLENTIGILFFTIIQILLQCFLSGLIFIISLYLSDINIKWINDISIFDRLFIILNHKGKKILLCIFTLLSIMLNFIPTLMSKEIPKFNNYINKTEIYLPLYGNNNIYPYDWNLLNKNNMENFTIPQFVACNLIPNCDIKNNIPIMSMNDHTPSNIVVINKTESPVNCTSYKDINTNFIFYFDNLLSDDLMFMSYAGVVPINWTYIGNISTFSINISNLSSYDVDPMRPIKSIGNLGILCPSGSNAVDLSISSKAGEMDIIPVRSSDTIIGSTTNLICDNNTSTTIITSVRSTMINSDNLNDIISLSKNITSLKLDKCEDTIIYGKLSIIDNTILFENIACTINPGNGYMLLRSTVTNYKFFNRIEKNVFFDNTISGSVNVFSQDKLGRYVRNSATNILLTGYYTIYNDFNINKDNFWLTINDTDISLQIATTFMNILISTNNSVPFMLIDNKIYYKIQIYYLFLIIVPFVFLIIIKIICMFNNKWSLYNNTLYTFLKIEKKNLILNENLQI